MCTLIVIKMASSSFQKKNGYCFHIPFRSHCCSGYGTSRNSGSQQFCSQLFHCEYILQNMLPQMLDYRLLSFSMKGLKLYIFMDRIYLKFYYCIEYRICVQITIFAHFFIFIYFMTLKMVFALKDTTMILGRRQKNAKQDPFGERKQPA